MRPKLLKYGGRGVDVKLTSAPNNDWKYQDPPADTVFWSPQKWREETNRDGTKRTEPAGGFNSFVCVPDEQYGSWLTEDGVKVSLISINGIGEIRWRVESYSPHYGEGAVEHFNLTPVKR